MKHNIEVTNLLVLFFLLSQFFGLGILAYEAQPSYSSILYEETSIGERPEFTTGYGPVLYLLFGVAFGTVFLLAIMKLSKAKTIWKYWYMLAVFLTLTVTLGVFLPDTLALALALVFAYLKIRKYNFWIHNFTEVFMYAGIALLFAPLFSIQWAALLLVLISVYDMYAVWKSEHMIKLARFTRDSKIFAGFLIRYEEQGHVLTDQGFRKTLKAPPKKKRTQRSALLGGGDILFPLLFAGAVFNQFLLLFYTKTVAFFATMTVVSTASISLYLLFYLAKKDKFYPAMPFLTIGCFAGYFLLQLILLL